MSTAEPLSDPVYCGPHQLIYGQKRINYPGILCPWVFNRAMVWVDSEARIDSPSLCYSDVSPLPLTGKKQASRWYVNQEADRLFLAKATSADFIPNLDYKQNLLRQRAANDSELVDLDDGFTRYIKRDEGFRMGHASLPPFQFNIDQHPRAVLEVSKATHPWRLMIVVKGRSGLPMYASPWTTESGTYTVDLKDIYRRKGYTGHFPELVFFMSTVTEHVKDEAEVVFRLRLEGDPAVISSLPVIRTIERANQEGVPIIAVVLDENARRVGADTVDVTATIGEKDTKLAPMDNGLWKAMVHGLEAGDYKANVVARWKDGSRTATTDLTVSVTDGSFVGYNEELKLLTRAGKPAGPLTGTYHGQVLFKQVDKPNEAILRGQKDWDEANPVAGKPDYGYHMWDSLTDKEIEDHSSYLERCGCTIMHMDQWWMVWARLDCGGRLAPHGTEQMAKMLASYRRHGIGVYFNLSNNQHNIASAPYAQYLEAGADTYDTRNPQSTFMKMYCSYAMRFADMFQDETALQAVSAAGERDGDEGGYMNGGAPFVNRVYDAYRNRETNHLFICEPFHGFNRPPRFYRDQGWKPLLGGFRTYAMDGIEEEGASTILFKLAEMGHLFMAEGVFFGFSYTSTGSWIYLDWPNDKPQQQALYRLLCRKINYNGLVYRLPILLTWEERVVEDERQVFEQIRKTVNWSKPFRTPTLAVRIGQKHLPPSGQGCQPLWELQRLLSRIPLENVYVWEDDPVPTGTLHTIDARQDAPSTLAFSSEGGQLPDTLKDQMPLRLPVEMSANYSWNEDGTTLLAFLRKSGQEKLLETTKDPAMVDGKSYAVGEVVVQNMPNSPLRFRLYDLKTKQQIQEGTLSKTQRKKIPDVGWDFFLLVTPD